MALNELIDRVQYAEVADVERYIRNQDIDTNSDPTESEVQELLLEASEVVDTRTNRAWRTRTVADRELLVKFTHQQQKRTRSRRNRPYIGQHRGNPATEPVDPRGTATLPHTQIRPIDAGAGDQVVVLLPRSTDDITANEGRDTDNGWVLDERKGMLHVDIENFLQGPIFGSGMVQSPKVRLTYRYGTDESGNDVSDAVPNDVTNAVAKMVAADLIQSDQYGAMIASGPENTPNQDTAAEKMREDAVGTMDAYRYQRKL